MNLILQTVDLTEASNIPAQPACELARDNLVRSIAATYSRDCQDLVLKGGKGEGKTNTLAQFARFYPTQTISYFVTDDPQTRRKYYYLQQMCLQMSMILGQEDGNIALDVAALESRFTALCFGVQRYVRQNKRKVYWVLDGLEHTTGLSDEDRIIDFIPSRFPVGPYLLVSWSSERIDELPAHLKAALIEKVLPFSLDESRQYFAGSGFAQNEIDQIHNRHHGNPASLSIIRKAKETRVELSLEDALFERDRILSQQIEHALVHTSPEVIQSLTLLAASPAPLPVKLLTDLTGIKAQQLPQMVSNFHLDFANEQRAIWFDSEAARSAARNALLPDPAQALGSLIGYARQHLPGEDFLLTLLVQEAKDYDSLTQMLIPDKMIHELKDSPLGLPYLVRKLRVAAELASERHEMADLLKWSLSVGAVRSFSSHAINTEEIEALIAIGESSEALKRVYAISDITTRIRLLASTYSAMQDSDIRVSTSALDELNSLVASLSVEDLDQQLLENLCVDLFPVLPDSAVSLLERIQTKRQSVGLFDAAINTIRETTRKLAESEQPESEVPAVFEVFKSKWINATSVEDLNSGLERLYSTRAKEEFIRRWCLTNRGNDDLSQVISTWLDVIIGDAEYTVPMKSLRQVCELMVNVTPLKRTELIDRLHIPEFIALRSPKQEWVRIRFALAEACRELEPERAQQEVLDTFQTILADHDDLDVQVFCLARTLLAVKRVYVPGAKLRDIVLRRFNESLFTLLGESADHLDHLGPTIQLLVEYDYEDAMVVSTALNTEYRRNRALFSVLRTALRKFGHNDIRTIVDDIQRQLTKRVWDSSLAGVMAELAVEGKELHTEVANQLRRYVCQIDIPSMRVYALLHLASIKGMATKLAMEALQDALAAWREIEDLKLKLRTGYEFVKLAAPLDKEFARSLLLKVQELNCLSGAPLASGSLGATYAEFIRLGLRSLTEVDLRQDRRFIDQYLDLIEKLPSPYVKLELFGMLASALLRCNHNREATDIVRYKLLPLLTSKACDPAAGQAIAEVLPVVYDFDPDMAAQVCGTLPRETRSNAWLSVILWLLSHCFLNDQEKIDISRLNLSATYRCLKECADITAKIEHDIIVFTAVETISRCVKTSLDSQSIEASQALDILEKLDRIALQNLPDAMNIQHLGYRILAQSRVHAARSHVWLKKQSASRGLNKGDIVRKWQEIRKNAEDIQNCADRVLVIASVAEDMCSYYKHGDKRIPREMLETAETELNSIPTAQDRLSRMEAMAQSWHSFGEDDVTKYLLQQIVASMDSIRNLDEDEQLRRVIQLADSLVDSDFASELAARIGQSGSSNLLAEVAVRTQKAQVLRKRPGELTRDSSLRYGDVREIMSLAADNLLTDIVSGKGRGIEQDSTIQQWLYSGTLFDSSMMVSICKWIVESSHRGSTTKRSNPAMFFELCHFAQQLSELTNASSIVGIPDSLHSNFAGLNSKYVEFRSGERKQAQKWLSTWLRDNARKFLKIVDPYLGLEELAYLNYVPENCIILVITTSQKLKEDITVRDIECYWHECVSSREMPYTRILVVPEHYENALHDRVIVTQEAGIDLGCSLNTLGKSAVKMALLPKDEAEELDQIYVQKLLDSTNWLLKHDVDPRILIVGEHIHVA